MSVKTLNLTPGLLDYLRAVSLREDQLLRQLRDETSAMAEANMQISPEQGQFMRLLIKLLGARRCLEIGVFTGYSALSVALALPADGEIVACDVSKKWTDIGKKYWERAGVANKISLHLAPALETLDGLIAGGAQQSFDFAFIDADKVNYIPYYEKSLELLRPGGLIAIDNVLWSGSVIDEADNDDDTKAIRALNTHISGDDRVDISLVPIGDGVTLARKKTE